MRKLMPLVLLAILVFAPMVQAVEENIIYDAEKWYNCSDDLTDLIIWANVTECKGTACNITTYNQTIPCHYGCDDVLKNCQPAPFNRYVWLLGIVAVIGVTFILVAGKK